VTQEGFEIIELAPDVTPDQVMDRWGAPVHFSLKKIEVVA
jgi:acyl CoA:acetate/3-ketoacid CoA transferase beta subunit